MNTFGEKLKQLRTDRGLSQERLAQMAGMGVGAVRDYEQGKKEPSFRYALMLAKALGVDCRELEFDVSAPDTSPPEPPAPKKGKKRGDA
jgi:transcriptional regulator with XRE-family HTH domain